ncbi:MAG: sialidase family protein [Armatimonadota bacterium]
MTRYKGISTMHLMWSIVAESKGPSPLTREAEGILLHEKVTAMPELPLGPFARLADGRVLAVDAERMLVSADEGKRWETLVERPFGEDVTLSGERAMLSVDGAVVLAFEDRAKASPFSWSEEEKDTVGASIPTCAAHSLDGKTWTDVQTLYTDWNGAIRTIIRTKSGRIVFTTMKMLHHPGRHGVLTCASDDGGRTWSESNLIDFGGNGHHDGAIESTIVELQDGRLLMYLRTNWGQFWRAESLDEGRHWHPLGPAGVDASSAPGQLFRLQSGRIMLLWNRAYPEGGGEVPLRGGDRNWSATPVSNFRDELSVAFSEDECESWSAPVVLARKADTWLAYPYIFEAEPGVVWITTMQGEVRITLRESDFIS